VHIRPSELDCQAADQERYTLFYEREGASPVTLFETIEEQSILAPPQKQMRDHQELFIEQVREAARKGHRRIIGCASVGWGKTLVSANLFKSGYSKGKVSMFTVPRNALIEPSVEEFEGEGLEDIGIIQQDHPRTNPRAKLQVASIHTAPNRELPHLDFIIVDEVHLNTKDFDSMLDSQGWKNTIIIGLSATPWKKGMGRRWKSLIQTKTTAQLIEEGYLVRPRYLVGAEEPNTADKKMHLDEDGNRVMTEKDELEVMGDQRIIGDIVKTYQKHGEDRPGFYYTVNLAHARQLKGEFESAGITCGYIDGSMTREQRNRILGAYRRGVYRLVVNYGVLTTGIDEDVRIIGICRIVKSETDWVQIIGRGLRTDNPRKRVKGLAPKTDVLVIDHGGNLTRDDGTALAPAEDIYHDHLDMHDPADKNLKAFDEDPKPATHRKCKKCGGLIPPRKKLCPACGDESLPEYTGVHIEAEFSEFNGQKTKKQGKPKKDEKQAFYSGLLSIAQERGYKPGWVANQYRANFGVWPKGLVDFPVRPTPTVRKFIHDKQLEYFNSKQKQTTTETASA
jgi:DNA repair protein RadD